MMSFCCSCPKIMSFVKDMNMTKFITNLIAFNPPNPCLYSIEQGSNPSDKTQKSYVKVRFKHNEFNEVCYPWIESECYEVYKKRVKSKESNSNKVSKKTKKLILLYIKNINAKNKLTFVFSHGNACDLGNIYPFLFDFATQMKV